MRAYLVTWTIKHGYDDDYEDKVREAHSNRMLANRLEANKDLNYWVSRIGQAYENRGYMVTFDWLTDTLTCASIHEIRNKYDSWNVEEKFKIKFSIKEGKIEF